MNRYLGGIAVFILGFALTTALFMLVLLAWGEGLEHAAPLTVDGLFLIWLATSALVGAAGVGWADRRRT